MSLRRNLVSFTIISLLVCGITVSIQATYYLDTLFPIGLTGLGNTKTSKPNDNNCPYYTKGWDWQYDEGNEGSEDSLIYSLGINCIGCEDAWPNYLIDFAEVRTGNTYLEEVLTELTDSAGNPTVYLITASYGAVSKRFDKNIIFKYTEVNL